MIRLAVSRPVSTLVATGALVVLGVFALARLPVALLPAIDRPSLVVRASAPDRSREEILQGLTEPMERRLALLPGITSLQAEVEDGACSVTALAEWNADADQLRTEAARLLEGVGAFPVDSLTVEVAGSERTALLGVAVLGGAGPGVRTAYASGVLLPELARLAGAGRLAIVGGAPGTVVVRPLPAALAARADGWRCRTAAPGGARDDLCRTGPRWLLGAGARRARGRVVAGGPARPAHPGTERGSAARRRRRGDARGPFRWHGIPPRWRGRCRGARASRSGRERGGAGARRAATGGGVGCRPRQVGPGPAPRGRRRSQQRGRRGRQRAGPGRPDRHPARDARAALPAAPLAADAGARARHPRVRARLPGRLRPFTHWGNVAISGGNQRYERLISDLQMVARANLIFGLHVHVGVEDRELQIAIMNQARYFLPHILALSVNSPFWLGRDTGWMSYRCKVFDKFPRTNIPDFFSGWAEYEEFVQLLVKTNCIIDGGQIWWDVRPHHIYDTLEYRICDIPLRAEETITIAALFQAITAKLYWLRSRNLTFRPYRRSLIMENKWRAARWGIRGLLIDFGTQREVPCTDLLEELLEFIDDVVDELGTREQIGYVRSMVQGGTGAERQLAVYRATNDLRAVMDYVAAETEHGLAG